MNKYKVLDAVLTIIVIILVVAAVTVAVVFTVRHLIEQNEQKKEEKVYTSVRIYEPELVPETLTIDKNVEIAVYFNAINPFSGIEIHSLPVSNFDLSFSVYAFQSDYQLSVSGKKLIEGNFSQSSTKSWLAINFGTLPQGEYLVVFSSSKTALLSTSFEQSTYTSNKAVVYKNGELLLNCVPYLSVIFNSPSENNEYFN